MGYISPSNIKPDSTTTIFGVKVCEYLLKNHNENNVALPTKRVAPLIGFTIHCTNDLAKVADDGRQYTAATLNGNMGTSVTNFYIDELYAWQNLSLDDMNWTCGDFKEGKGSKQTISLEVIMNGTSGADNAKARDNSARLVAYLLYKYGMTANDLYTHNYWLNIRNGVKGDYDYLCTTPTATRDCPYYILHWQGGWTGYRKLVNSYVVALGGKSVFTDDEKTKTATTIFQSLGTAAIRTGMSKTASITSRAVKGDYYPVDVCTKNSEGIWLRHAGKTLYSMYSDGQTLFKECGYYDIYRTTNNVNVRATPNGNKVDILRAGTIVYAFRNDKVKKDGYTWQKIVYNGTIAYVADAYLEKGTK